MQKNQATLISTKCKKREHANLLKDEKLRNHHEIPRKEEKMRIPGHQGNGPL